GMAILIAICSPASNYGFDQIRETLDRKVVATATGLANMGGFTAGMIAAQLFGILLDKHSGGEAFEWGDFRYAALAVLVVWSIGLIGILVTRGGTRPRKIRMETVTDDYGQRGAWVSEKFTRRTHCFGVLPTRKADLILTDFQNLRLACGQQNR